MTSVGDNYILPGKEDHDRLRTISDLHDERTHTLLHRAGFAPGCRFVEFGCGLGYVTRWAAAEGAAATGIDVNEEQVHACRALAREAGLEGATFRTGSVYEPGFETGTIDVSYNRWLLANRLQPRTTRCGRLHRAQVAVLIRSVERSASAERHHGTHA
jgi:SAM-dependent methyltransferase